MLAGWRQVAEILARLRDLRDAVENARGYVDGASGPDTPRGPG